MFVVDEGESELSILDLIQVHINPNSTILNAIMARLTFVKVFVEALDRQFQSVCELDMIYHPDVVNHVLNEIIVGGFVVESISLLKFEVCSDFSNLVSAN